MQYVQKVKGKSMPFGTQLWASSTNLFHHGGLIGVNFGFLCFWTVIRIFRWFHQFRFLPKVTVKKMILMIRKRNIHKHLFHSC